MTVGEANKLYVEGYYDAMAEVGKVIANSTKDGLTIDDARVMIDSVTAMIHDAFVATTKEGN